ncbi:MAG: hypothetical protein RL653_971 [Pseudomonadota bacterium]|jgi:DNA-binding XRE family transcriptional regulator
MSQAPAQLSARIRRVLRLTQREWAAVLGIEEKSLARLETRGTWVPSMRRLVKALLATPVRGIDRTLAAVLSETDAPGYTSHVSAELRRSISETVKTLAVELQAPFDATLGDLVEAAPSPSTWVYWATRARADAPGTRELADREGIICRPLRSSAGRPLAYLSLLAPGHRVLLCHDGEPMAWYELVQPKDGALEVDGLPPVFRDVELSSRLGKVLAAAGYKLGDGSDPAERRTGRFTCLAVRPVKGELQPPVARAPGNRDALTPYAPSLN